MAMTRSVIAVPDGAFGFDCLQPLTSNALDAILAAGWTDSKGVNHDLEFCFQYIENLTADRISMILSKKTRSGKPFGLMTVGTARSDSMANPSAALGTRDGQYAVSRLQALQVNMGVTHGLDVEGPAKATGQQVAEYINAAAGAIRPQTEPASYDGWGINLTAAQLFTALTVRKYWASSPYSTPPMTRGFGMIQVVENVKVAGWAVDIDQHHVDGLGDSFMMLVDDGA